MGEPSDTDYGFTDELYSETSGASISADLDLTQDAARMTIGGTWRMPTIAEMQELFDNTERRWTIKDGVPGMLFTSAINGQSIFVPAMGYIQNGRHSLIGQQSRLWSSTYYNEASALEALIRETDSRPRDSSARYTGLNIRAVRDD